MKSISAGNPATWQSSPLASMWALLRQIFSNVHIQRRERRLRLSETLSLGEKRLIAVVEFEQQRFLVAATPENISLLQTLSPTIGNETRASEGA